MRHFWHQGAASHPGAALGRAWRALVVPGDLGTLKAALEGFRAGIGPPVLGLSCRGVEDDLVLGVAPGLIGRVRVTIWCELAHIVAGTERTCFRVVHPVDE